MAHAITEDDYGFIRDLSFGYAKRRNLPTSWREDAAHYSVVQAMQMAEYHNDSISPFQAALTHYVSIWTMKFFMWMAGHAWRKNAYKTTVIFMDSDDLPERTYEPDHGKRINDDEYVARRELFLAQRTDSQRKALILLDAGLTQTEVAQRLGVSRQAVNDMLKHLRRRLPRAS